MTFGGFDRIGKKQDLTPYPFGNSQPSRAGSVTALPFFSIRGKEDELETVPLCPILSISDRNLAFMGVCGNRRNMHSLSVGEKRKLRFRPIPRQYVYT